MRFMRRKIAMAALSALLLGGAWTATAGPASAASQKAPPVHSSFTVAGKRLSPGDKLTEQAGKVVPGARGQLTVSVVAGSQLTGTPHAAGTRFADSVVVVRGGTLPKDGATTGLTLAPDNASGCSPALSIYATCISITGSKLTVSTWETDAYYPNENNNCDAQFIAAGVIYEEDYWGCGYGPGRYTDYAAAVPVNFPNNTQVCNYWPGSTGGKPCETIHS